MADAGLSEIFKMLGELTATSKALNSKVDDLKTDMRESVDDLKKDMRDSETASTRSRANVHHRLDEVVMRTGHLESDMLAVKNKVEKVEGVSDDVVILRHQAAGAGTLGKWLLKIGIAVVGFAGWAIGIYTWMTGRPPP